MTFAEAVASRAGCEPEIVEAVLSDHGVQAQPTGASPVSLVVDRVAFSGTKRRQGHPDEPFAFENDLGPGLWVVTSRVRNLAGKSSVLFVIRWALTGRSHLTDDVFDWIEKVDLDGRVGDESFTVRFSRSADALSGELDVAGSRTAFGEASFEEVMEGFFLDRLRLDPTPFWQSRPGGEEDEGDRRRFGWTGYFPALHLRAENQSFLLGDQAQGGHPGALMQVFLGLPWALTASTARVALREVQMRRSARTRREAEDAAAREHALAPLRAELVATQQQLADLRATRAPISPGEADRRLASYAEALAAMRAAEAAVEAARTALQLTQEDRDDAVKRLDALEQSRVVRPLLGRLSPTMCPRCNVPINPVRVAHEHEAHACSVCSEPLLDATQDEQELVAAREAVGAADEQVVAATSELAELDRQRAAAAERLATADALVRELEERRPAESEVLELERAIARLEGRLEQPVIPRPEAGPRDDLGQTYNVLRAALAEAEGRRGEAATQLLDELGEEIAKLGRAFGIANLESATPSLNARLALRIGGAESNFSSRTGGERLRLRLATVLALLRVANRLGIGRHPGLLLIDSPGGEEMVEGDVESILRELRAVCDELPELQVICATARTDEVLVAVEEERVIRGADYGEVW